MSDHAYEVPRQGTKTVKVDVTEHLLHWRAAAHEPEKPVAPDLYAPWEHGSTVELLVMSARLRHAGPGGWFSGPGDHDPADFAQKAIDRLANGVAWLGVDDRRAGNMVAEGIAMLQDIHAWLASLEERGLKRA
jgi:hypothetical protein